MHRDSWYILTWRHPVVIAGALAVVLGQTACSLTSFSETYYAGVVDKNTGALQFYRFEMEGRSGWTRTKFVSGMYAKEAIDAFVGEEMKDLAPKATDRKKNGDSGSARFYTVTGPEGEGTPADDAGKLLVLIMSSDPEPITKAISEFAKSKAVTNALEQWANRAREANGKEKKRAIDRLGEAVGELPDGEAKTRLQTLLSILGGSDNGEEG